jgi:beta-mannosidase
LLGRWGKIFETGKVAGGGKVKKDSEVGTAGRGEGSNSIVLSGRAIIMENNFIHIVKEWSGFTMQEYVLNGQWELRDEALSTGVDAGPGIGEAGDGWISAPVPGDIHQGLLAAGRIKEPLVGLNSFECDWIETRSWWFRRRFATRPEWRQGERVELELNGLDSNAAVFMNGKLLGVHKNAFYPFVADIKDQLKDGGENVLLVRLTTGVEEVQDRDLNEMGQQPNTEAPNGRSERGDPRRAFVRKPQYSFGWDWSPRLATVAIAGDVRIRAIGKACIRDVYLRPRREKKDVLLDVTVTVDLMHDYQTSEGEVRLALKDDSGKVQKTAAKTLLRSGLNFVKFEMPMKEVRFWWPNGLGEQHLYTVRAEVAVGKDKAAHPEFPYGLRFVELDTAGTFAFRINGKKLFCKGANWIPADALYARVTDERYGQLVREAGMANFNMLRIWGGGLYEREAFYRACDREGILVWQDFMFACAPYPDHRTEFCLEVRKEAEYQTRRLRNHACLAVWSGNNECNEGLAEWWPGKTRSGYYLYNYLLPEVVQQNCPNIPYWNGSPYGGTIPSDPNVGDRHHWRDCTMNAEMARRITPEEYDKCTSKFISEYGYIGAPVKETVQTYLDGAPFDRQGRVWQHHNNTFEKNTVDAGIQKHYRDPDKISLDEYFLYSGLVQGLMYGYSLESQRFRPECHGSLFWMYEDCWGEVGWTIIDYYLRRKIAWYFVKRAFEPVRLILREKKGTVLVTMANDTAAAVRGTLEFGRIALDGTTSSLKRKPFVCPPLERKVVATFKKGGGDPVRDVWIARVKKDGGITPAVLRTVDFRQLALPRPTLSTDVKKVSKDTWLVEVGTDVYAHAVHLRLPASAEPSDDYFDLLPGERRQVRVTSREPLTRETVGADGVL